MRRTGRDPLEAAVVSGVAAGEGAAPVADQGLVARVALATGEVLEVVAFDKVQGAEPCGVGGTARGAWIACMLGEKSPKDVYNPFAVMRVPLGGEQLSVERPVLVRDGEETEMRTSPSGGVMLLGGCRDGDQGTACVRQPSGKWVTVDTDVHPRDHGAGALLGGQVALVRGLWDGDVLPRSLEGGKGAAEGAAKGAAKGASEKSEDEEMERWVGPFVTTVREDGKVARVGSPGWGSALMKGGAPTAMAVLSPIEEGEDHALSFMLRGEEGVWAVVLPRGEQAASFKRLAGMTNARVHQDHGVAVGGEGEVLGTSDGGRTWSPIVLPGQVKAALAGSDLFADEWGSWFAVSAVGMRLDTQLRIGWGAPGSAAGQAGGGAVGEGTLLPPRGGPRVAGSARVIACASRGTTPGAPLPTTIAEVSALLGGGVASVPTGVARIVSVAGLGNRETLNASGLLEQRRPASPAGAPVAWTLRWFDPLEVGARPHSWTGPAPSGTTWGVDLSEVNAAGGRALFTMRAGSNNLLVRVKSSGGVEVAKVPWDMLPSGEVVFGAERGEAIAWVRGGRVVVWLSGEQPRILVDVPAPFARMLIGKPTQAGVPLMLARVEQPIARLVPIVPPAPPAFRGGEGAASAQDQGVATLPLEGWTFTPELLDSVGLLPVCGARPQGALYRIRRAGGRATVDGAQEDIRSAVYEVRVHEREACVVQATALVEAAGGASVKAGAAQAAAGPVRFVRSDFAAMRGDGGKLGTGSTLLRLACTLEGPR